MIFKEKKYIDETNKIKLDDAALRKRVHELEDELRDIDSKLLEAADEGLLGSLDFDNLNKGTPLSRLTALNSFKENSFMENWTKKEPMSPRGAGKSNLKPFAFSPIGKVSNPFNFTEVIEKQLLELSDFIEKDDVYNQKKKTRKPPFKVSATN